MSKAYFGGVPTDGDVNILREKYPASSLTPGKVIPYTEIESALIDCNYGSHRFRTVTWAWRKQLAKDSLVYMKCANKSFVVLDESGKSELSNTKLKTGIKHVRKSGHIADAVDVKQLDEEQLRKHECACLVRSAIRSAEIVTRKRVSLPESM